MRARSDSTAEQASPPYVFISYAHEPDSTVHHDQVWRLYELLRAGGIDARLDLVAAGQRQDWPLWMADQIRNAEHILVIASARYREHAHGHSEPEVGQGVQWEARLIRDAFYRDQRALNRFLPVVLPGQTIDGVPDFLGPATSTVYHVCELTPTGVEPLMRLLTHQPRYSEPPLGTQPVLAPQQPSVDQEQANRPGRRLSSRRTMLLGGLLAMSAASVPTALILSQPSRSGTPPARIPTTPPTGPAIVSAYRVLTGNSKVDAVAFSPHGDTLASSNEDGSIRLWNTTTWHPTDVLTTTGSAWALAYSPDGGTLAGGDGNSATVTLWDTATKHATTLTGQVNDVFSVAFSPDGKYLASGSPYDTVEVWDVASKRRIAHIFANVSVNAVAFNQNRDSLAFGCHDGTVQLWDVPSGTKTTSFAGHTSAVESVAFSPNWAILASGSNDLTVRLWDVSTGDNISILRGHTGWIESVAFSPDGSIVASASNDFTIRLWSVGVDKTIAILRGHTGWVESVAFSPDGRTIASASTDNTIRLWKVPR